jgi:2-keto-4-pentenoate hydratase/2-oxohepta-3-ene-1,7-dioic acid hydratase in catechol pathway
MMDETGFIDLSKATPELPNTIRDILEMKDGIDRVRAATSGTTPDMTLDDVKMLPVIPRPNAIWALALNYKKHVEETGLTTSHQYPHIFLRQSASQVGHKQPLLCPHPDVALAYDYEGELAVIIGKAGRHIPVEKAMDHVAGYSIYNEGSVREFQGHNRQFGLGKNFESSGSFGPWMTTPDEFGNPYEHELTTRLNGKVRQHAKLDGMLFNIEEIIHYLSTGYFLVPGDVIITGDVGQLPPEPDDEAADLSKQHGPIKYPGVVHMRPGDIVEVEVPGLGILENPVIGDEPVQYRVAS